MVLLPLKIFKIFNLKMLRIMKRKKIKICNPINLFKAEFQLKKWLRLINYLYKIKIFKIFANNIKA